MRMRDMPDPVAGLGTFFFLGRYTVNAFGQLVRASWEPGETFLDSKGREYVVAPGGNLVRFFDK